MTEMPVVMCNEALLMPNGIRRVLLMKKQRGNRFNEGLGGLGVTDEHIDAIDSNDDEPAP